MYQKKGALICPRIFICPCTSLKSVEHLIYVQYGCKKQSKMVYSLNHDITASFILYSDPEMPKSDLALSQCNKVIVYSCPWTSLKGATSKHLIYVQYGCEKQSKVVYSLQPQPLWHHGNNSTRKQPNFQNVTWPCLCSYRVRMPSYAHGHHWKLLSLDICQIWTYPECLAWMWRILAFLTWER